MCYKLLIIIIFIIPFFKVFEDDDKVFELA